MREIEYLNTTGTPMYSKGKCHAITINLGYRYDGQNFIMQDVYHLPEGEEIFAEELQDPEVMGRVITEGVGELNLDMRALEQLFAYKIAKDAETSSE